MSVGNSTPSNWERNRIVVLPGETEEEAYNRHVRRAAWKAWCADDASEKYSEKVRRARDARELKWVL